MAIVRTRKVIDDAGAAAVLAAAEQAANAEGHRVVIAVVDPWGELVELRRTAGAQIASSRVAVDKARTAAIFVRPSREMEEQVTDGRIGALALHGAVLPDRRHPARRSTARSSARSARAARRPTRTRRSRSPARRPTFSVAEVPALTYEGARFAAEAAGAEAAGAASPR